MVKSSIFGLVGILMALALVTSVSASFLPTPISGQVINTGYLGGIPVKITDLETEKTATVTTDEQGWFVTDWGNLGYTADNGDRFEICVYTMCKQFTFIDKINQKDGAVFDIRNIVTPNCPPEKECPVVTCPVCPEPPVCLECPDCPEQPICDPNQAIEILLAAIASAGVAGGAVYVKLGKTAQHLHKGIVGYHSIFTVHKNADIKHPRGEVAPKYIQVNGEWKYKGD
jgi:hypothetical protein